MRLWNALSYVMGAVAILAYARLLFIHPSLLSVAGRGLIIVAIVAGAYQMHKGRSARAVPSDLGSTYIDFHLRELERQRAFLVRSWRYLLLPLPGTALLLVGSPPPNLSVAGEFVFVLALLFFGIMAARRRQARKLQREIDALADAERKW